MSEERFLLAYQSWVHCGRPGAAPKQASYGVPHVDLSEKIAEINAASPSPSQQKKPQQKP